MRKSVMKSMIIGAVSVMLVSMIVFALFFMYNIGKDKINDTYEDMHYSVSNIKPVALISSDYSSRKMKELFNIVMKQFSVLTKYNYVICDSSDEILYKDVEKNDSEILSDISRLKVLLDKDKVVKSGNVLDVLYNESTITYGEKVDILSFDESVYIMCSLPTKKIRSEYYGLFNDIFVVICVSIIFMAVFLYLFSKNITTPLKKINSAVGEFSKGNFKKRVDYKSDNEIGELAHNINLMAHSIENLEKTRSDFISDISHELRTPLTTISGFVQGILDGTIKKEDEEKYLEIVLSESKRLSRLINAILKSSKYDDENNIFKKEKFDILELTRLVVIKFEEELVNKCIDVTIEAQDEKIVAYACIDAITQVLINLIHNAVKFTNNNGYIKINLSYKEKKCIFEIENSCDGIDEEKLPFIWQRFYKTDESRSSDTTGVGLGLYIVKKIIDLHGEKIDVLSNDNSVTFTFTLSID